MRGHLVIADISGYTRFLTESELEHANGIIADLLNALIAAIHAPLRVSNIEGDAVFMYGVAPDGMSGQTIVESVELLYAAFAGALETMVLNTTCRCNACANISNLGLKIVMHCGEFAVSEVGGRETLNGPDVIVPHRLLKNHVVETTGVEDYLLLTEACVEDLGLEDMVAAWVEHTEEYEHVGKIKGYVSSLRDVWEFMRNQNEDRVLQRDAWVSHTAHSTAPPAVVWDHMIDPVKKMQWMMADSVETINDVNGRVGVGAEYHCAHGDYLGIFTVLDMKPLDYVTFVIPITPEATLRYTDYVIPSGGGTRFVSYAATPFSPQTGENLTDDEGLAELAEYVRSEIVGQVERMMALADAADAGQPAA
jgi:hypothetical protein